MSNTIKQISPFEIDFKVVGTTFRPKEDVIRVHNQLVTTDNTSYDVTFQPESNNQYDPHAIKIIVNGTFLGYVPASNYKGQPFNEVLKHAIQTHPIAACICRLIPHQSENYNDGYRIYLKLQQQPK